MSTYTHAHSVLFIGSAPPRSATAVFEAISKHVGGLCTTVPDGDQAGWLLAVMAHYAASPQLEAVDQVPFHEGGTMRVPVFRLKSGVKRAELRLGPYGYAAQAEKSYAEFKRLRKEGKFPADTRFQVTLPSPMVSIMFLLHPPEDVLPAAEAAFKGEIDALLRTVPAEDLLISWDVCEPVSEEVQRRPGEASPLFKRLMPYLPSMTLSLDSVARAAAMVPAECGLGMHLCYGSSEDKHAIEPIDAQLLVDFMNGISARVTRSIDWMHFPTVSRPGAHGGWHSRRNAADPGGQGCARQIRRRERMRPEQHHARKLLRDARYASQGRAAPLAVRKKPASDGF